MKTKYQSYFAPSLKEALQTFKESILSATVDIDTENPTDEQILRIATASEQSAINLYRQLRDISGNEMVQKVLDDIIDEEIVHVGEFDRVIFELEDKEIDLRNKGSQEVDDLLNK